MRNDALTRRSTLTSSWAEPVLLAGVTTPALAASGLSTPTIDLKAEVVLGEVLVTVAFRDFYGVQVLIGYTLSGYVPSEGRFVNIFQADPAETGIRLVGNAFSLFRVAAEVDGRVVQAEVRSPVLPT